MELLTQSLPSGEHYPFSSIHIDPMNFAQILEYMENVPDKKKNPIEHYYFNYCLVKDTDPNIDYLLLIDLEYVLYMKKAITIAENLSYDSSIKCPRCGESIDYHVSLANVEWDHMDPEVRAGLKIQFAGQMQAVRMPRVGEFMDIFKKYRAYKRITDMRIIKLITLFENSMVYLQRVEQQVINATYKDIAALMMLEDLYYSFVKPKVLYCNKCIEMYEPTDSELFDLRKTYNINDDLEIPDRLIYEVKQKHGGIEIGMESLVSNFFRDLNFNNRLTGEEIISGEIR